MKKLSIEEKAMAYDKAIERAKKVHKYSSDLAEIKRMEEIFPELNWGDDERIRKFLIDFIKVCRWSDKEDQGWPSKEDCIVWLEKQGEQKPAWNKEDEDYYDAILAKLEVTQYDAGLTDNQMEFLKSLKDKMK